jgi:hypothetical protein
MSTFMEKFQQGCTGVSWIFRALGRKAPAEWCCDEHDVAYNQGGSWKWKIYQDAKLARCIFDGNEDKIAGFVRALGAWLAVTFLPYPYIVWKSPERR